MSLPLLGEEDQQRIAALRAAIMLQRQAIHATMNETDRVYARIGAAMAERVDPVASAAREIKSEAERAREYDAFLARNTELWAELTRLDAVRASHMDARLVLEAELIHLYDSRISL